MVARDGRLETGEEFEAAVERAMEAVGDLPADQAALVLESAAGCARALAAVGSAAAGGTTVPGRKRRADAARSRCKRL